MITDCIVTAQWTRTAMLRSSLYVFVFIVLCRALYFVHIDMLIDECAHMKVFNAKVGHRSITILHTKYITIRQGRFVQNWAQCV